MWCNYVERLKEAKFTQKKRAEIAGGPSSGFATPVIGVNKEKKAKVAFEEMHEISRLMKSAVVKEFPVPKFKRCKKEEMKEDTLASLSI